MKLNKVLIYLGILVALAAYVYLVEIKQKEKTRAKEEQAEKIVNLKKEDIVSVEIQADGSPKIELKKAAGQWVLVEPVKSKGDDPVIDTLLHSIVTGKREKIVKEKDVDWAEYGLDKPSLLAVLGTKDGATRIAFGSTNPSKTSYYVRVNDNPQLLLVTDVFRNAVNKKAFDLRDKSVVTIAEPDVNRLAFTKDGSETELRREAPDKWVMTKPEQIKVKKSLMDTAIRSLTNLRARDIIDAPSDKPEEYGFDKPEMVVTITGKEREDSLIVGKPSGDGKGSERYAMIKGQTPVYVIDGKIVLSLKSDPASLQDRAIFTFDPQGIDKLTLTLDGTTWEAARGKDNKWHIEKPEPKKEVEAWHVTRLLWDMKGVEWKAKEKANPDEPARFHLDRPKLVATLVQKDGKPVIEFKAGWEEKKGPSTEAASESAPKEAEAKSEPPAAEKAKDSPAQAAADTPETVYAVAQPEEEPGMVYVLDSAFLKRLREGLKDFGKEEK
ncbi:MAG: DUF4340 domain-containing protein [Desulfomonile sp.]|nr:DUF4340 domain-containing protein [Desulfomonile sp.]